MEKNGVLSFNLDGIMENAVVAVDFDKLTRALIEESSNSFDNLVEQKRAEDWSALANQVIGAEISF
jgi:hypothetical protein